jgi:polysaccharide biosynthesis protein VpsJ
MSFESQSGGERARSQDLALSIPDGEETTMPREVLVCAARRRFELAEALDWKSYDPYDILLSPSTRLLREWSPLASRILIQLGRRSGSRLRRILSVPPHEEPKAVADFLQAAALLARNGEGWAADYAPALSTRLVTQAVRSQAGHGWGIQFPWVSRFGCIAAGEPNIYTTTFACQALLDDYELEQRPSSLHAAIGGVRFLLRDLGSLTHRGRTWLRYTATSTSPIINVQASSASLFSRIADHCHDEGLLEAADRAADAVVASQGADGSWTYSDDGRGAFVDGFHSGFTLQGLQEYAARRKEQMVPGTARAIKIGFAYFREHLLTPNGLPRGFADGRVSLNGQNLAQAIQTLLVCGDAADRLAAARIWRLGIQLRPLDEGGFPALRWSIGPSVLATAFLVRATEVSRSDGSDRSLAG